MALRRASRPWRSATHHRDRAAPRRNRWGDTSQPRGQGVAPSPRPDGLVTACRTGRSLDHGGWRAARPLVAGNWKMNGLRRLEQPSCSRIMQDGVEIPRHVDLMVCPPATLVAQFAGLARGSRLRDRRPGLPSPSRPAPITGDISAEMLADAGAVPVIVGHSERRSLSPGDRRAGAGQGAGRLARRPVGDRLRRRDAPGARGGARPSTWSARQLDGSLPEGARGGEPGDRLRAGLGDRHRADADAGRRRRGARPDPRASSTERYGAAPARRCASSTAARSSRPMRRS